MSSPAFFDPYNHISYVELNKRKRGDYERDESQRIENRLTKPSVKKIYVKRNGDALDKRPKLFVWREWQSPGLRNLLQEVGPYVGLDEGAAAIYDLSGRKIEHEEDIRDLSTFYVTGDETLLIPDSEDEADYGRRMSEERTDARSRAARHTSLSAPEYPSYSRNTLYERVSYPPTPPPQLSHPRPPSSHESLPRSPMGRSPITYTSPYSRLSNPEYSTSNKKRRSKKKRNYGSHRSQMEEFDAFYREAIRTPETRAVPRRNGVARSRQNHPKPRYDTFDNVDYSPRRSEEPSRTKKRSPSKLTKNHRAEDRYRSRSANEDRYGRDETQLSSDFHHEEWMIKDRENLAKHKEKHAYRARSNSNVIYNRRDQTNPDAYIVYVFLNGHGMDCQYVNFKKNQLEKGMNYVLELIARRYNVNPSRLCNMDGRRISEVSDLMSRGAYVLVPVGQAFRDTWYFLPDNAIDTSSNQERVDERSAQRDRLIQRRDKRLMSKANTGLSYTSQNTKPRVRSEVRGRGYR